MQINGMQS